MGRFLTTRRSEWLPGVAWLGVTVGVVSLLGFSLGLRSWTFYVAPIAFALLALRWIERRRTRHAVAASPQRARARLKVVPGPAYNLAEDDTTDSQKYVM
jgi:hypothetical protein